MKTTVPVLFVMTLLTLSHPFDTPSGPASEAEQRAQELWEQALAAKGGREKLYQVRNLVINEDFSHRRLFQRKERRYVWFYVFPNKLWYWVDDRPGILGLNIEVLNVETRQGWSFQDQPGECLRLVERSGGLEPEPAPDDQVNDYTCAFSIPPAGDKRFDFFRIREQLCFLLETPWVKPVPIKAETVKSEFGEVDALHTHVEAYGRRYRVVFFLDRKTHLPLKVGFQDLGGPLPLQDPQDLTSLANYYGWISMSNYVEVAGIQMPQKLGYEGARPVIPISFEINVDYDEGVFSRPPSIEAGPEAWRPKRKSQ